LPGWFDNFVDKKSGDLEDIYKGLDDLRVDAEYEDALNEIKGITEHRKTVQRYYDLDNKLRGVRGKVPQYREEDETLLNPDHLDFDPNLEESQRNPAVQQYLKYAETFKNTYKDKNPIGFEDYLNQYPDLKQTLRPEHYTTRKKQVPLTDEEYENTMYQQAGFTDEDKALYTELKKQGLGIPEHNEKLNRLLLKYAPYLTSSGKKSDKYLRMLQQEAELGAIPLPEKTKYSVHVDPTSGKIVYYDPTNPGNEIVNEFSEGKDKNKGFYDKIGFRIVEKDGKYVYQIPTPGGWEDSDLTATEQQYQAYLTQVEEKGLSTEEKLGIRNQFKSPGRRTGRKLGSSNVNFGNFKPGDFSKVDKKYIDKLGVGDLNELSKNSQYLSKEAQSYLDKKLSNVGDSEEQYEGNSDYKQLDDDRKLLYRELEKFYNDFDGALGRMQGGNQTAKEDALMILDDAYEYLGKLKGQISDDALNEAVANVNEFIKTIKWPY